MCTNVAEIRRGWVTKFRMLVTIFLVALSCSPAYFPYQAANFKAEQARQENNPDLNQPIKFRLVMNADGSRMVSLKAIRKKGLIWAMHHRSGKGGFGSGQRYMTPEGISVSDDQYLYDAPKYAKREIKKQLRNATIIERKPIFDSTKHKTGERIVASIRPEPKSTNKTIIEGTYYQIYKTAGKYFDVITSSSLNYALEFERQRENRTLFK